jgi:hypothetical protein
VSVVMRLRTSWSYCHQRQYSGLGIGSAMVFVGRGMVKGGSDNEPSTNWGILLPTRYRSMVVHQVGSCDRCLKVLVWTP